MKGIVFTEFIELVEDKFGIEMVDKIISSAELPSGGAYTAVGTYSHSEMVSLLTELSSETSISIQDLLLTYGAHFFSVLSTSYPAFFKGQDDCFSFLESIDNYIHPEVLKLYPDAELPHFSAERVGDKELSLVYASDRALSSFAEGLIQGTVKYFNVDATVEKQLLEEDGTKVRFVIKIS